MPTMEYTGYKFSPPPGATGRTQYESIKNMPDAEFDNYVNILKRSLWHGYWKENSKIILSSFGIIGGSALLGWVFQNFEFLAMMFILTFGVGWMLLMSCFHTFGSFRKYLSGAAKYVKCCRKHSKTGMTYDAFLQSQQSPDKWQSGF